MLNMNDKIVEAVTEFNFTPVSSLAETVNLTKLFQVQGEIITEP